MTIEMLDLILEAEYQLWISEQHAEETLTAEEIMNNSIEVFYSDNSQEDELPF